MLAPLTASSGEGAQASPWVCRKGKASKSATPPILFSLGRAVNILPNRVVGSVGQHAGEPVEKLALSHCGRFLASSGHDQRLKFWDMTQLRTLVVDDYRRRKKKGGPLRALSSKAWSAEDFFAGLRDEEEGSKAQEEGKESEDDSD